MHVENGVGQIYNRSGADLTRRFRLLQPALREIPARSAIIDAELVACDAAGMPCFHTLMSYRYGAEAPLCLWAFDLLQLDGVRLMPLPIEERRQKLAELIATADTEHIQFSGSFTDPQKLLETCERMGLEGIVSKRRGSAYRPGPSREWLKTKTTS